MHKINEVLRFPDFEAALFSQSSAFHEDRGKRVLLTKIKRGRCKIIVIISIVITIVLQRFLLLGLGKQG